MLARGEWVEQPVHHLIRDPGACVPECDRDGMIVGKR